MLQSLRTEEAVATSGARASPPPPQARPAPAPPKPRPQKGSHCTRVWVPMTSRPDVSQMTNNRRLE